MSKIRLLQIEESGLPGETDIVKVLPGTFDNHRHAHESIEKAGNYAFLEVHALEPKEKQKEG